MTWQRQRPERPGFHPWQKEGVDSRTRTACRAQVPAPPSPVRVLLGLCAGLGLALAGGSIPAFAHASIDVADGKYVMEVGFRDEPVYAGEPNAIYLHVGEYGTGGTKPVDGLAATLKAEVSRGGQTLSPPLVPVGDGSYEARFVPTEPGDYTFRITGTIGDAPVDEAVTSGPTSFDSVQPLSAIEFPPPQAGAESAVQDAQAAAAMARNLAIAGIVAGILGLLVAGVALTRAGRAAPVAAESRPIEPTGKLIR